MIIIKLEGGLGNQLFQYAFGYRMSVLYGVPLKFDVSFYEEGHNRRGATIRNIELIKLIEDFSTATPNEVTKIIGAKPLVFLNRIFLKLNYNILSRYLKEFNQFSFIKDCLQTGPNVYVDGYWQSYKYFNEVRESLINNIKLQKCVEVYTINFDTSIALHIRRGDYVNHTVHNVVQFDYYKMALETIQDKFPERNFTIYIFSDDIDWCKQSLNFNGFVMQFVNSTDAIMDFSFMRNFKFFIIANSTFSWWAAWLSTHNDKIVIAPKKWISLKAFNANDFFPKEWIQL